MTRLDYELDEYMNFLDGLRPSENTSDVRKLLLEFLLFYSEFDFQGKVISIRTGKTLSPNECYE